MNAASADFRPLLSFMLLTGCRPGEGRQIRVRDLDLAGLQWVVRTSKTQHARDRRGLPPEMSVIDQATVDLLAPLVAGKSPEQFVFLRGGQPWTKDTLSKDAKQAVVRAGLDGKVCTYSARHTYVCWRLRAGVPLLALAQNLRTSVAEIERSYGKFLAADRRALLERGAVDLGIEKSNIVSM